MGGGCLVGEKRKAGGKMGKGVVTSGRSSPEELAHCNNEVTYTLSSLSNTT